MAGPYPKLRHWYGNEVAVAVAQALSKELQNVEGSYQSCLNCTYFNEEREACAMFDNRRPPARVIAYGCNAYSDTGDIPF